MELEIRPVVSRYTESAAAVLVASQIAFLN
jgi:hypothetical protein